MYLEIYISNDNMFLEHPSSDLRDNSLWVIALAYEFANIGSIPASSSGNLHSLEKGEK